MASAGPITAFTRRVSSSLSEVEHELFHCVPMGIGGLAACDEEPLILQINPAAGGFDEIEESLAFGPVRNTGLLHALHALGKTLRDPGCPFEMMNGDVVDRRRTAHGRVGEVLSIDDVDGSTHESDLARIAEHDGERQHGAEWELLLKGDRGVDGGEGSVGGEAIDEAAFEVIPVVLFAFGNDVGERRGVLLELVGIGEEKPVVRIVAAGFGIGFLLDVVPISDIGIGDGCTTTPGNFFHRFANGVVVMPEMEIKEDGFDTEREVVAEHRLECGNRAASDGCDEMRGRHHFFPGRVSTCLKNAA